MTEREKAKRFCIRKDGKLLAAAGYYDKKPKAKVKRDDLGGEKKGYTVSPGPDHYNWRGL